MACCLGALDKSCLALFNFTICCSGMLGKTCLSHVRLRGFLWCANKACWGRVFSTLFAFMTCYELSRPYSPSWRIAQACWVPSQCVFSGAYKSPWVQTVACVACCQVLLYESSRSCLLPQRVVKSWLAPIRLPDVWDRLAAYELSRLCSPSWRVSKPWCVRIVPLLFASTDCFPGRLGESCINPGRRHAVCIAQVRWVRVVSHPWCSNPGKLHTVYTVLKNNTS